MIMKSQVILFTIAIFIFGVHCTEPEDTLYDIIVRDCPLLQAYKEPDLKNIRSQAIFDYCKNWTAISQLQELSDDNKLNVRCLLYHDALISLCNRLPEGESHFFYNVITKEDDPTTIQSVCENLSILSNTKNSSNHINDIIKDEIACKFLCLEYRAGKPGVNSICAKSFFLNSEKLPPVSTLINQAPPPALNVSKKIPPDSVKEVNLQPSSNLEIKTSVEETSSLDPKIKSTSSQETVQSKIQKISEDSLGEPSIKKSDETSLQKGLENNKTSTSSPMKNEQVQINSVQAPPSDAQTTVITGIEEQNNMKGYVDIGQNQNDYDEETNNMETPIQSDQLDVKSKAIQPLDDEAIPDRFKAPRVSQLSESNYNYDADMDGNSYFFTYFTFTCVAFVIGYVGYHNKQKVLALLLEGRHSRKSQRGRRPNSSNYHKLDCNLEEAISSSCNKNTSHIIY